MSHLPHSPGTAVAPSISLLGSIQVLNPKGVVEDGYRTSQLTRLAAWLVLNPGLGSADMERALWISGNRRNTRSTAVSKLRKWLGTAPDGTLYLPHQTAATYALHPAVMSDWDHFRRLISPGINATPNIDLEMALHLVLDRPFTTTTGDYSWAEPTAVEMTSVIRDTAYVLASRAAKAGDLERARWAIHQGYLVDQHDELLARTEFRIAAAAGDREEVTQIRSRLLGRPDGELSITTLNAIQTNQPRPREIMSCLRGSRVNRTCR
jgi:hypothetical protein